jgi:hypothetical protein
MAMMLETINNSRETTEKLERDWQLLEKQVERISRAYALFSGFVYAAARLALLAVAFAAFRKQDERLYVDTWARFLPSIG